MPLGFVNASVGPAGSSTGFLGATEYRTDVVAGDYNNLSVSKGSSRFPLESVRARGTACIKAAFAVELGSLEWPHRSSKGSAKPKGRFTNGLDVSNS